MIFNMILGGGGGGLKVNVSAIAPGEPLPDDGELGDILIETTTELSGREFWQPTPPEGEPQVGDVWFETKEDSPVTVNLAEEGAIIMGLKAAYVWGGTGWVTSKYYIKNESGWSDTAKAGYLFADGKALVEFTSTGVKLTENDGYLSIDATSGASGYYRTAEAIDLANYKTLHAKASATGAFGKRLAAWSTTSSGNEDTAAEATISNVISEVTLDVSELSGQYTVGVLGEHATSGGGTFEIFLYDLWLE